MDAEESFEFHTHLAPGRELGYEEFHRAIPADLDAAMRAAGVVAWQIHRNGTTLTHRVVARGRRRTFAALDADPVNARWQREVGPYLVDGPPPAPGHDPGHLVWDFTRPTR